MLGIPPPVTGTGHWRLAIYGDVDNRRFMYWRNRKIHIFTKYRFTAQPANRLFLFLSIPPQPFTQKELLMFFCSYFFENISREMAEAILTMGDMFGNLLMRRSTSYPNSYALSFRSTVSRTTEIFHYEIGPLRKHNSIDLYFEIKMEGRVSLRISLSN